MAISSVLGNAIVPTSYGFRNVIINGNFSINQRGYTSGANLASGAYGFDRWKSNFTNTALTFTSAPQGQTVTISASGVIRQIVERANIQAGSYVLSWVGTAQGRVYNDGAAAPSYAAGPLSVYLDGTANVVVEFTPASGTATLGQVQLEFGSRATPFEPRPIGVEVALCQRYYEKSYDLGTAPGTITEVGVHLHSGSGNASGRHYVPIRFKVEKRTNSYNVATYSAVTTGSGWRSNNSGSANLDRTPVISNKGTSGFTADVEDGGYAWFPGNTRGHWTVDAEL